MEIQEEDTRIKLRLLTLRLQLPTRMKLKMTNDNKQDKDPKKVASSEAVTENVKITNYVKCKCKSSADRITYDDVEKAIKQLAATGIEINSNTIRDHLKHGSFSTIIKHMNTYLTKELATTAELEFTQNGIEE